MTTIFDMRESDQNHKAWQSYKRPPKEVLEKVYEDENRRRPVTLPADLTESPIASSTTPRRRILDATAAYPPSPVTGWSSNMPYYMPYPTAGPSNAPHYLPHPFAGPLNVPYYPSHPITSASIISSNPLVNEGVRRSPSNNDDNNDNGDNGDNIQYPSISEFFTELTKNEGGFHYFENYTDAFHQSGFYRIDQLADETFTVNDMLKSIEHLKEGTARVIKKRAVEKVKRIQRGKRRR